MSNGYILFDTDNHPRRMPERRSWALQRIKVRIEIRVGDIPTIQEIRATTWSVTEAANVVAISLTKAMGTDPRSIS